MRLPVHVFAALALLAGVPARAQDPRAEALVVELRKEFRQVAQKAAGFAAQKEARLKILERAAEVDDLHALQFLVDVGRDARHQDLRGDILGLLVAKQESCKHDSGAVAELFEEHMDRDDPHRRLARTYLYRRAVDRKKDDEWLRRLYRSGMVEDRFLALQGMGKLGLTSTLYYAEQLRASDDWQPVEGTVIRCGTIARALEQLEGAEAARLLLLLQRDPRFTQGDALDVRDAIRLWKQNSLLAYIDLATLASPDAVERASAAHFMGEASVEVARAPLLRLARDRNENADVRAAAATALGGLTIAKGDLARSIGPLLEDPNPAVQLGAVEGLARLRVKAAARLLADLVDGPLEEAARKALADASGADASTDWRRWANGSDCPWPEGT